MKNLIIALFIIAVFLMPGFCAEAQAGDNALQPLTLDDCFKLALKQSELIAIDAEKINQAEAHFLEAFGAILPQVSFVRTNTRQHSVSTPSYNKGFEQKFVFQQELFSGFKEFAGIAVSKFEKKQRENEKLRAEQLLFVDVSDSFYLYVELQEDSKALQSIRNALSKRISELKTRENIGKSRTSEVVSTQTQLYNIDAEIELVKSQAAIARELLEFLIGRPAEKVVEEGFDFSLKDESDYTHKAILRADVQAANLAWKVSQEGIAVAKSGFYPELNLTSDYYGHRFSVPRDASWDALLSLNVPIFEGTTVYGQVKEARSVAKQNELLFKRAERVAAQDVHDAYTNMQFNISRGKVLDRALKSAELNFHLQIQDYNLNVVNNLDVITAIQNLEDARRSSIHSTYEGRRFYWQLMAAAGEIEVK